MAWKRGTVVSVSRLPTPGQPMARALGLGRLLDPLEAGRSVRIRLDEGRALAPTPICRIEEVRPDVVRVQTRNHRYELRRIHGTTTTQGVLAIHDELGAAAQEGSDPDPDTRVVRLEDWAQAQPGRFASGARVRVTRVRGEQRERLGPGVLLVDLQVGEIASFSLEGGVVGTSPILAFEVLDADRLALATGRSVYEVELRSPEETDADGL